MVTKKTDYLSPSKEKMLSQFKDKPNIEAVIDVLSKQSEDMDCAIVQVFDARDLSTATDAQLDVIGREVGEVRGELADEVYRALIRARILVNTSNGTFPTLVRIVGAVYDGDYTTVEVRFDPVGGTIKLYTDSVVPNNIPVERVVALLCEATAAGVDLQYDYPTSELNSFRFDGPTTAGGFGTVSDLSAGGQLGGVIAASQLCDVNADTSVPLVTITPSAASYDIFTDPNSISFQVEFTDNRVLQSVSLAPADIQLIGSLVPLTPTPVTITGSNPFTVTITDPLLDALNTSGTLGIDVAADRAIDGAGNGNRPSASSLIPVSTSQDFVDPGVSIIPISTSLELGEAPVWNVAFSDDVALEPSPDLLVSELTLGAGHPGIASIVGSNPYTVTGNPTTTVGSIDMTVNAGAVEDAAGNQSDAVTSATISVADTVGPTAVITFDAGASQLAVDVASPKAVWDVQFSDAAGLAPGAVLAFTSSTREHPWQLGTFTFSTVDNGGGNYTVTCDQTGSPNVGTMTLGIDADSIFDNNGNGNLQIFSGPVTFTATPFTVTATYAPGGSAFGSEDLDGSGDGLIRTNYDMTFSGPSGGADMDAVGAATAITYTGTATFSAGPSFSFIGNPLNDASFNGTMATEGTFGATGTFDPSSFTGGTPPPGSHGQGFLTYTFAEQTLTDALTVFETFVAGDFDLSGTSYAPTVAWSANDATTSTWPSARGAAITLAADSVSTIGSAVITDNSAIVPGMFGVKHDANTYWRDAGSTLLDLAVGEDLIIEHVARFNGGHIVQTNTSSAFSGVLARATSRPVINIRDNSGNNVQFLTPASETLGQYYYVAHLFTRAGQIYCYDSRFGVLTGSHTVTDAITGNNGGLNIGGSSGAVWDDDISYVGLYKTTGLDYTATGSADFVAACDARVTLLGVTPGTDF